MIKQTKKQMLMLAAIASIGLSAPSAFAQVNDVVVAGQGEIPYVIDARNVVARSGTGLCWRTGYWSPAAASTAMAGNFPVGCACDSDIVPADRSTTPVAAAAPAPKPTADKVKLAADALFDFDKAVLKPEGKTKLNELAAQAKALKLEVHPRRRPHRPHRLRDLQPAPVRASRRRRQDLPGFAGRRCQPRLHRRQGRDPAGDRQQVRQRSVAAPRRSPACSRIVASKWKSSAPSNTGSDPRKALPRRGFFISRGADPPPRVFSAPRQGYASHP